MAQNTTSSQQLKDYTTYKAQPNAGMQTGSSFFTQPAQGTMQQSAAMPSGTTMQGQSAPMPSSMGTMQMPSQTAGTAQPIPQYPGTGQVTGMMQSVSQAPPTVTNPFFLAGYLQRHIGRTVRVEFMLGTSGALTDRSGQLSEVGASYIVLRQYPSGFELVCDLYSIRFVTIYP